MYVLLGVGAETSHHLRVHPSSLSVSASDFGTPAFVIHILTAVIFVSLLLLSSGLLISSAIWAGNLLHTVRLACTLGLSCDQSGALLPVLSHGLCVVATDFLGGIF